MIKTASEIIDSAMNLAGTYNQDFLTSQMLISELNDAYRKVYDEIAESDADYFIKEFRSDEPDFKLPCDLYKIKTVAFLRPDGRWDYIPRQPAKEFMAGHYYIENECFHFNGESNGRIIQIRYVPQPTIITAPRESIKLDIPSKIDEWGMMDDDGVYFKIDEQAYYINFSDMTANPVDTFIEQEIDAEIDYDEQTINGIDFSNDCHGNFVNVCIDDPYMMISYEDGAILLFENGTSTHWNIEDKKGHGTKGIVKALHTDDTTLYGCIWQNKRNKRWYLSSYVPDTVLVYPKNTLWKYMETSLAVILMSLNGIRNDYITNELLPSARYDFLNDLQRDRANVYRIANVYRRGFK